MCTRSEFLHLESVEVRHSLFFMLNASDPCAPGLVSSAPSMLGARAYECRPAAGLGPGAPGRPRALKGPVTRRESQCVVGVGRREGEMRGGGADKTLFGMNVDVAA